MGMLAAECDYVIGVDTHRDTHTYAICDPAGGLLGEHRLRADGAGYRQAIALAGQRAPGVRVWAIEGAGSYGAGLARVLGGAGERVIEVERPRRPPRRAGARSDAIDALRAARQALADEHQASPRAEGRREALRVLVVTREGALRARTQAICQLAALILTAPEPVRERLRALQGKARIDACAALRIREGQPAAHQASRVCLRASARRIQALSAEAGELAGRIEQLVLTIAPWLLDEPGVGPICAAQVLISWSHPGRLRSEAAFAALAGVAPIPASSGQIVRHRLNRGGDRQLNRALHTIARSRMAHDPASRAYLERRRAQGRSPREVRRCLVRYIARQLYRRLEGSATLAMGQ